MQPRRSGEELALGGGRVLGYDEYGPPDGRPVLYFHGVPSSRLDFRMFESERLAERLGARVIAVDRPGCGLSDFQPRRRIGDWPRDVASLANGLGMDRFAVMGWSGGAPYALACASLLPHRVTKVAVVSGMGPWDVPGLANGINPQSMRFFTMNRDLAFVGRLFDRMMELGARRGPAKFLDRTLGALPPVDRVAMSQPGVASAYVDAVRACFRSGPHGGQVDTALMVGPWGFDPWGIEAAVSVWHGEQDGDAPPAMGRWLARELPDCRAHFYSDEGLITWTRSFAIWSGDRTVGRGNRSRARRRSCPDGFEPLSNGNPDCSLLAPLRG